MTDPVEKIVAHDFGVAVIKEAAPRRPPAATERFQAPRLNQFLAEKDSNYPKSWIGVITGKSNTATSVAPKKVAMDGAIAASAVSSAPVPVLVARVHVPASPAPVAQIVNAADFATMMASAIEAALKPMKEKLEATIIPMQRTIESLQAEFVAMREDSAAGDDAMLDATASETALAKRVNDTDRAQTRATRLKITSGL